MTNVLFEGDAGLTFDEPATEFPDYSCELCQTPLSYSGRGRKPKKCSSSNGGDPECFGNKTASTRSTSGRRSSAKDVEAAMAAMDTLYGERSKYLMLFTPPAAEELDKRLEKQRETNRACFEASPSLAKRVASVGGKGGVLLFLLSNVSLIAVVGYSAYTGLSMQAAMFQQMTNMMGNQGQPNPTGETFDLGKIFNLG
jgi:hypothetical protein